MHKLDLFLRTFRFGSAPVAEYVCTFIYSSEKILNIHENESFDVCLYLFRRLRQNSYRFTCRFVWIS